MIIDDATLEKINVFVESYITGFINSDITLSDLIDLINNNFNIIKNLLSVTELNRSIV
jgi:hypothetical protein